MSGRALLLRKFGDVRHINSATAGLGLEVGGVISRHAQVDATVGGRHIQTLPFPAIACQFDGDATVGGIAVHISADAVQAIATSLCHLAFWDQRVPFLLREWESSGKIEASRLSSQSVDSINQAVNAISQAVPGPTAGQLALDCASAVDSHLEDISDEFVDELVSAGFERYFRRSLHRREHIQKIREVLEGQRAGESLPTSSAHRATLS
jgi:hypothetical protein